MKNFGLIALAAICVIGSMFLTKKFVAEPSVEPQKTHYEVIINGYLLLCEKYERDGSSGYSLLNCNVRVSDAEVMHFDKVLGASNFVEIPGAL